MTKIILPSALSLLILACRTVGVSHTAGGFAEVSPEGRATQERVRDLVRSSGMRMIGPNCLGVLNTDPAISLNATFAPHWPPAGNIG